MKIIELKLDEFLDVIQKEISPQEKLNEFKNKTDWFKNICGGYSKVINIQEKENILNSIITIEIWDIQEFTPIHSYAYSNIALEIVKLKQYNKDLIKNI